MKLLGHVAECVFNYFLKMIIERSKYQCEQSLLVFITYLWRKPVSLFEFPTETYHHGGLGIEDYLGCDP